MIILHSCKETPDITVTVLLSLGPVLCNQWKPYLMVWIKTFSCCRSAFISVCYVGPANNITGILKVLNVFFQISRYLKYTIRILNIFICFVFTKAYLKPVSVLHLMQICFYFAMRYFMLSRSENIKSVVIEAFNSTSRYLHDLLYIWSYLFRTNGRSDIIYWTSVKYRKSLCCWSPLFGLGLVYWWYIE